jgi:hypothetical protein
VQQLIAGALRCMQGKVLGYICSATARAQQQGSVILLSSSKAAGRERLSGELIVGLVVLKRHLLHLLHLLHCSSLSDMYHSVRTPPTSVR